VKGGDLIEVHEIVSRVPPKKDKFGNAKVKAMRVVYEDDHLAVVVKPAGEDRSPRQMTHGTGGC
jgi:23S rRNA-/tRNA-specific pseudouridylate synthase